MKIIHCSDLHLDSPLKTHLSAAKAKERNEEILHTFARMVDYAREQQAEAVLIAGDLFDARRVRSNTADFVLDTIARASEIRFFYLRGNHDESTVAFSGRTLPGNLTVFGNNWETYDFGGVTITGIVPEDWSEALYAKLSLPADKLNIVMMHGQTAATCGNEQICLPALKGKHISYLALGHLHRYEQDFLEPGCSYCYCGCLEGRGFDECGEKGFVELTTDDYGIHTRFVPFAKRQIHEIAADITGLENIADIRQALLEAGEAVPEQDMVRFLLQGAVSPDVQADAGFLMRSLEDRYLYAEVQDQTVLRVEKADYEYDISLRGAFLRSVMESELPEEEKDAIIRFGLAALAGEDIL